MSKIFKNTLQARHQSEKWFQAMGMTIITIVLLILASIIINLIIRGLPAFTKAHINLEIELTPDYIVYDEKHPKSSLSKSNLKMILTNSLVSLTDDPDSFALLSSHASITLFKHILKNPKIIGKKIHLWVPLSDDVDQWLKYRDVRQAPKHQRHLTAAEISQIKFLHGEEKISQKFNFSFFSKGDSRNPEQAGIWGAFIGTVYTLLITIMFSFPLGIASAIYLEEFAPRNKFTLFIDLSISNLASIPAIIFGLLGLMIFLNMFHLQRSSALVGGLTLALMTLPTIIIASRSALQTVPNSIREAAEGLGASSIQAVFHQVLPLAFPGIFTGALLGLARSIGECSCLLMIGMVAFIVNVPVFPSDPTTVLPIQIFNWARNPEAGFAENTAAAILILLLVVGCMNLTAIVLRRRFEHKW